MKKENNIVKKTASKVESAKKLLKTKILFVATYFYILCSDLTMITAYASGANAGDDKFQTVIDFITPWITKLGGVVILFGAVEFGLAFKNDDPEGKTKGVRTAIAGCIVFAVGMSADLFLK